MIKFTANEADRILTVEMTGMISEADIDSAFDALQARYPAVGVHVRIIGLGRTTDPALDVTVEASIAALCAKDRETGSLEEFTVEGADGDVSWSCVNRHAKGTPDRHRKGTPLRTASDGSLSR